MDSQHRYIFAALSILGLSKDSWTCQVIDGHPNNNKWDNVIGYKHTPAENAIENFNGPYIMNFTVQDGSATRDLVATVFLNKDNATLTDGNGVELSLPSNGEPQIQPGIDGNGGSQVWLRYQDDTSLRELRFHTPLNANEVKALLTGSAEWLLKYVHL